jgi:multicomponent Na+:H+ antiporter subunit C
VLVYVTAVLLLGLGLYALLFKRNLIRIVIGVALIQNAVNLFLIGVGYVEGGYAPVYTLAPADGWQTMVLPTPQALTLTAIVIGLATTALMLSLVIKVYENYKTLDAHELGEMLRD